MIKLKNLHIRLPEETLEEFSRLTDEKSINKSKLVRNWIYNYIIKGGNAQMGDVEKGYNGWKNYETWVIKLWIDNDQGSYNHFRELAKTEGRAYELGQLIQEEIEEMNPIEGASLFSDLMTAALSEVDWREIAESLLEEVGE